MSERTDELFVHIVNTLSADELAAAGVIAGFIAKFNFGDQGCDGPEDAAVEVIERLRMAGFAIQAKNSVR